MKRRLIKLGVFLFIILTVFEIYYFCKSNKINYVALEEGTITYSDYLNDYLIENNRVRTYHKYISVNNIGNRIKTNNKIKRDLRESDLVSFFTNNINLENKLIEIRKYAKKDLIIIGYNDIGSLCDKYKCKYIRINKDTTSKELNSMITSSISM